MSAANGRPVVGLALGGGGARGLAHIGVLRVLEREGITPACIAGTSMGGLVGALFAAGVSIDVVEEEAIRLGAFREQLRLVDVSLSAAGLSIRGRRIYNMMADLLGEELTFADLRLPLAMVAVDLITGREVILQGGRVIDAVRASISIPGVFESVELGNYRLVDGGVLDNVPIDVALMQGATRTIAVDVLPSFTRNVPGQEPVEMGLQVPYAIQQVSEIYHVLMIMLAAQTASRLEQSPPDLLIRPTLPANVTLLSGFNRAAELIAAGVEATEAALPDIRALLAGDGEEMQGSRGAGVQR